MDFFYDAQIERFFIQFIRALSGFTTQSDPKADGTVTIRQVPTFYAAHSRQVANILSNNSQTTMLYVPSIACSIAAVSMAPEERMNPTNVDYKNIVEQEFDEETQQYTGRPGDAYTVTRYSSVPYKLRFQADILTSNMQQKLQLFEQIGVLFNPSIDIQSSENPLDDTFLSYLTLVDINWSSLSIPRGSEDSMDVMTLQFETVVRISPPAKVNRLKVIHNIKTSIYSVSSTDIGECESIANSGDYLGELVSTFENYRCRLEDGILTLLGNDGSEVDDNGSVWAFRDILDQIGSIRNGVSKVSLFFGEFGDEDMVYSGVISEVDGQPNKLNWTVIQSTLPALTLPTFKMFINPLEKYPSNGLPNAVVGDRYLISRDIGESAAWGNVSANAMDIIEYDGTAWNVIFDSTNTESIEYSKNENTGKIFKWDTGWTIIPDGEYREGYWRFYL